MAAPVTFTGLGSGLDLQSILDAQIQVEEYRYIQPYQDWKSEWEEKLAAFQELNTKLSTLYDTTKSMDTPDEFYTRIATSSAETVVTASAQSNAINDTYAIEVNQLAQSEKEIHSGVSATSYVVHTGGTGSFVYTYGSETRTLDVADGTTLAQLVAIINNDSRNPGVNASILNDGSGDSTAYHLVLSGNASGADNTITVDAGTNLSGWSAAAFSDMQAAQNAQFRIDGYPSGSWLERDSNTISDVISCVTMTLQSTGSATVTISDDTDAIKEQIYAFVAAVNEVRNYVDQLTAFDADTGEAGVLLGNYGVDAVKSKINSIVGTRALGFDETYDSFVTLMDIGIYTDTDEGSTTQGDLIIDESALNDALAYDAEGVAGLFSASFVGRSASADMTYLSHIDGITDAGTYEIRFDSSNPAQSQIRLAGGQWYTAIWDAGTSTLTGPTGSPGAGLEVRIDNTGADFSGEIQLQLGMAGTLGAELDFLTDPWDGTLYVLERNYQDIIDGIDDKIADEQTRITKLEQTLSERYARLEAALTELNSQGEYLSQRLSTLQSS